MIFSERNGKAHVMVKQILIGIMNGENKKL